MLCQECNTREATISVTMVIDGRTTVRHLCPACMASMRQELAGGNVRGLLQAILSAITAEREQTGEDSGGAAPEAQQPDIVCPRCGTTLRQFTASGRLGCPDCYAAFREQLQPILMKIHGRVQHAGRTPLTTEAAQRSRSRQEELTRLMQEAIAVEDFETAAVLRDRIHALAAREEGNE